MFSFTPAPSAPKAAPSEGVAASPTSSTDNASNIPASTAPTSPQQPLNTPPTLSPDVTTDARVNALVNLLGIAVDKTIVQPFRIIGGAVWSATRGTVRVDLVRPTYPQAAPYGRHVPFASRVAPRRGAFITDNDTTGYHHNASHPRNYAGSQWASPSQDGLRNSVKRLASLQSTGSRCKIMRHLDVGPLMPNSDNDPFERRMFDVGVGINYEVDNATFTPVARIKLFDTCSFKLYKQPVFKFQRTWDLKIKGLALRTVYEVPLNALDAPWAPPARIMLRLDNIGGQGVHFTDGGLEFDQRIHARSKGGVHTLLRAAGGVRFPRQYPVQEGTQLLDMYVRNLGLKTQW